jgi:hypothetical protein
MRDEWDLNHKIENVVDGTCYEREQPSAVDKCL